MAQATILMQAFCNTCSDFHIEKIRITSVSFSNCPAAFEKSFDDWRMILLSLLLKVSTKEVYKHFPFVMTIWHN